MEEASKRRENLHLRDNEFWQWKFGSRDLSGQLTDAATFLIPKVLGKQCQWGQEQLRILSLAVLSPCSASGLSLWLWLVSHHKMWGKISNEGEWTESTGEILEDCRTKKVFSTSYRFSLPSSSYLLSSFIISSFHFKFSLLMIEIWLCAGCF